MTACLASECAAVNERAFVFVQHNALSALARNASRSPVSDTLPHLKNYKMTEVLINNNMLRNGRYFSEQAFLN